MKLFLTLFFLTTGAFANQTAKEIKMVLSHPGVLQSLGSASIQSIHQQSNQRAYTIITENCALTASLVESCAPCMPDSDPKRCPCSTEVQFYPDSVVCNP